jgi:hypothetical protein
VRQDTELEAWSIWEDQWVSVSFSNLCSGIPILIYANPFLQPLDLVPRLSLREHFGLHSATDLTRASSVVVDCWLVPRSTTSWFLLPCMRDAASTPGLAVSHSTRPLCRYSASSKDVCTRCVLDFGLAALAPGICHVLSTNGFALTPMTDVYSQAVVQPNRRVSYQNNTRFPGFFLKCFVWLERFRANTSTAAFADVRSARQSLLGHLT